MGPFPVNSEAAILIERILGLIQTKRNTHLDRLPFVSSSIMKCNVYSERIALQVAETEVCLITLYLFLIKERDRDGVTQGK